VDALNARFRRSPFDRELWRDDGSLGDAGLLVHTFDGWENHELKFLPGQNGKDQCASFVFAGQRIAGHKLPLFSGAVAGIIFRPGSSTRLLCGKGKDSGGQCGPHWCPSTTSLGDLRSFQYPGDGCDGSWRSRDFGVFLERTTKWQRLNHRMDYNEIVVSSNHWSKNMPYAVEAIFGDRGVHSRFLEEYGIPAARMPHLELDPWNWDFPLRVA